MESIKCRRVILANGSKSCWRDLLLGNAEISNEFLRQLQNEGFDITNSPCCILMIQFTKGSDKNVPKENDSKHFDNLLLV